MKTAKYFSAPLMKQTVRSNRVLTVAILIVMILMCVVITAARNMISSSATVDTTEAQTTFFTYLTLFATSNAQTGAVTYSYADFITGANTAAYEALFAAANEAQGLSLSVAEFQACIDELTAAGISIENCVSQFEYTYALAQSQGAFGGELSINGVMLIMLESMGMSQDMLTAMGDMDMSSMLNTMYYTIMGLLPLLVYVVVVGNSLVASQVDKGSMAYVLSTPTKRSAVANTQALYMIVMPFLMIAVTCCVKLAMNAALTGSADAGITILLYLGMYILIEAIGSLCYLGSCLFNRSGRSMAFGGGLTVWFFLASLLGLFGSDMFVELGMGVEALGVFNNLTLIGLFDVTAIGTVGTAAVDYAFLWKFAILIVIAIAAYVAGAVRFNKKDLPL